MSQLQYSQPTQGSSDEQVAIVGYAQRVTLPSEPSDREQIVGHQVQAIRGCLRDAGVPLMRIRQRNAATVIGVNEALHGDSEPFMIAPLISRELDLNHPGMTVEFGEVSGMAAVHFAKCSLLSGEYRFAVVAETCFSENGDPTMNIVLLQKLSEAMQDGHQVHGLIKETALGFQVNSEILLRECCQKADVPRSHVLKVEGQPESGLDSILSWIANGEAEPVEANNDLDTAAFSAYSKYSGTRVALLLQTPMINSQVFADDAFQQPLTLDELAMSEGAFCELFQIPQSIHPSPWSAPQTISPMPWSTMALGDSGACSYGLPSPQPGYSQLNLQWHGGHGEIPAFLSLQHGEV